jgi:hypothetical protein
MSFMVGLGILTLVYLLGGMVRTVSGARPPARARAHIHTHTHAHAHTHTHTHTHTQSPCRT